jgi:hypothetical protein
VAEPSDAVVTGLREGDAERSAGEFFEAFVDGTEVLALTELPAGEAFDLLFEDD